jgi:hypothetical protein
MLYWTCLDGVCQEGSRHDKDLSSSDKIERLRIVHGTTKQAYTRVN